MEFKKADIFLDNLFLYKKYNIILISTKEEYKNELLSYLKKGSSLLKDYEILSLSDKECFMKMGYSNNKFILPILIEENIEENKLENLIIKIIGTNFNKFNKQFNIIKCEKIKESISIMLENINAKFIYLGENERNKLALRKDYLEKEQENEKEEGEK